MRSLLLAVSAASTVVGIAIPVFAQNQPSFEKALRENNYPTASNQTPCYAKTDAPNTFDLSRLCGIVTAPIPNNIPASSTRLPNRSRTCYGGFSAVGSQTYMYIAIGSGSSGVSCARQRRR